MADLFDILLAKNLSGGGVQPQGEIEITENGEYDVASYASANVDVPSPFPVTVTFMNGTEEWAKVGVDGEGKIAEPTEPSVPSGYNYFSGWYDGQNKITFPYAPAEDKTLVANFKTVRTEMEISEASTVLFQGGGSTVSKSNAGTMVLGYAKVTSSPSGSTKYLVGIADSETSAELSSHRYRGSYEYSDKTYYYCQSYLLSSPTYLIPSAFDVGTHDDVTEVIKATLDHYFYKD